ncbi:MAG: HAMP domain-containing histidine kinase [Planctomycetes bacterium]|nr:HAMP domain-containing histidine kinase [Planctomycetota bacterium]
MTDTTPDTRFAPAERAPAAAIQRQTARVGALHLLTMLADSLPQILLILNHERQIVFANKALAAAAGLESVEDAYGLRPGEVLDCLHATELAGGCGTTEACRGCNVVRVILAAQASKTAAADGHILRRRKGAALDLRAQATSVTLAGEEYVFLSLTDISSDNRRRALERIFFHDVLNTAGGLRQAVGLLRGGPPEAQEELLEVIDNLSRNLLDEIRAQQDLALAESDELTPHPVATDPVALLREIAEQYRRHEACCDRRIVVDAAPIEGEFVSDPTLLGRVLGNLVKNALEASAPGESTTLILSARADTVEFRVHNPAVMPREVQLQIFQRAFSTKGPGRGLGTYGAKLLTERYLGGRIRFVSEAGLGTMFVAAYPRRSAPGA